MFHASFIFNCLLIFLLCASKFHPTLSPPSFCTSSDETASAQFGSFNVISISYFFTSPRSNIHKVKSCFLIIFLILCGDIQLNPGPSTNTFNVCTLNICSLLNPLKFTAISDLAESRRIDLFALTETWITSLSSSAEPLNATPPGFTLHQLPSPSSNHSQFKNSHSWRGHSFSNSRTCCSSFYTCIQFQII